MKKTIKTISLLLWAALMLSFTACTQTIQVRFVTADGEDRTFYTAETAAPVTQPPVTENPVADVPATDVPATDAPATETPATEAPATEAPNAWKYEPLNKKGVLYKTDASKKIWAGLVGSCYIVFKDIDEGNEWGETGRVYELYVTYIRVGENYSMWSDGFWELSADGSTLTLTPKNQGGNGNIGVEAGQSKTFNGNNGVFEIPLTFEQGGKTTVVLDLSKNAQ